MADNIINPSAKIIASPSEDSEYCIEPDISDEVPGIEKRVFSVYFRKTIADGTLEEYDFEHWKTFNTLEEASDAVAREINGSAKRIASRQ